MIISNCFKEQRNATFKDSKLTPNVKQSTLQPCTSKANQKNQTEETESSDEGMSFKKFKDKIKKYYISF